MLRPARGVCVLLVSASMLVRGSLGAQRLEPEEQALEPEGLASHATAPRVTAPSPPPSPARHASALRLPRFRLLASVPAEPVIELEPLTESTRLFHEAGDPDSLFTFFGSGGKHGELRLRAALELNDIVLRAMTPDPRMDRNDTRPRAAGDFRALDAAGRPYQLRLGARLVW